jgi:hypothetical protein
MQAALFPTHSEPRWKTYAQVALLFLPAFLVWTLMTLFAFPALSELWQAASFSSPLAASAMQASKLIQYNFLPLLALGLIALIVVELRSAVWQHHRKLILWSTSWCFNAIILMLAAGMLWTAILSAGKLLHWQW